MERKHKLIEGYPAEQRVDVPEGVLEKVRLAYEAGRYVDAYAHVLELGSPLQSWRGPAAQTLGARLATNLSAERLGDLLITRAWREAPRDAETLLQYGYRCMTRSGPMQAWELLAHHETCDNLTPSLHADHLALRADIAITYRDFNTASALLREALGMEPASPWLLISESRLLQAQESWGEALDKLDEALAIRPWYRPAVQYRGRLLHLLNRRAEGIQFLTESLLHLQSSQVVMQLVSLKREEDDHPGVLALLDQYEAWAPMLNPLQKEMLAARRADALYLQRHFEAAAAQAELVSGKYYTSFAKKLHTAAGGERRVRLPVNFVLQGHRTCGPATLALIAQHWQHPARQEQIVQAICYDGTYDYSERQWCEDNGFAAREFRVTWESLRLLIDAGVPFALATVEVGSAHLQTVIGYDEVRETLFLQDPGEPHYRELEAAEFLEEYRLTGPRGMAVVPADRRSWLQSLALPDAALYDLAYAFNRAIAGHLRQEAAALLDEMAAAHPRHRLTLFARLSLASFDGNTQERQQVLRDMLEEYPDDMRVLYWHLQSLREVGRPEERIALLRRVIPMEKAHPSFLKELAVELAEDHRHRDEARRLLWWAHRCSPVDSAVLSSIGVWKWREQQARRGTLDYFRFAASLSDKVEIWSVQWFNACVALNRTEEALVWLRQRFENYGDQSAGPATTLAMCLERLCRTDESLAVIDEAVSRRPGDGELLVHAARLAARFGKKYEAQLRVEQARRKCPPGQLLRAEAAIAARDGDHQQVLALWQEVLESEPLNLEAHQSVANTLSLLKGREAGTRHLNAVCARFPHHYDLNQARVSWLREHSIEAALPAALAMQENFPEDAWLQRELSLIYHALGRFDDALQHASAAVQVDPGSPPSLVTMATALQASGRAPEAAECCHKAIRHDVNFAPALSLLTDCVTGSDARRAELEFIRSEMVTQVLTGETLHLYRALAYGLVEPGQLMGQLREVWQARPDLWEAWSVLASQAQDAGEVAEAARLAEEASRKFPLLPGAWRDLGLIKRIQGNNEEALKAFRRATELNPDWDQAWADLAQLHEDLGQGEEAVATLRSALKRMPRESSLLMLLALLLWRSGEREEPWKILDECIRHEPLLHQAWRILATWSAVVHKEKELESLARAMTREHPGQAQTWLILAQILGSAAVEERLQAIDRAIEIHPGLEDAYDLKAILLAGHGRFDEARQVLKSGPWKQGTPASLAGRSAWLMVQQGKPQEGMNALRKVLEKHRDFRWGWERYYELAEHLGQRVEMRQSAKELVRLSPRDPGAYCRAAMVDLQAGGNEKSAIQHLERALHLEPAHEFAARVLLEIYWNKKDLPALEKAMGLMLPTGPTRWVRKAFTALAQHQRRELKAARYQLDELAQCQDDLTEVLPILEHTLIQDPKFKRLIMEAMDAAVTSDRIGPSFAVIWIREQARAKHWGSWRHFADWIRRMHVQAVAPIQQFLDLASDSAAAPFCVPDLLNRHRDFIHGRTELWASAGRAMVNSGMFLEAADWMRGAEVRPDVGGWMLGIYVIALTSLNQTREATEASLAAVRLGLRDDAWALHVSQAAFGTAMEGEAEKAKELLQLIPSHEVPPQWQMLHGLGDALSKVLTLPRHEAKAAYKLQRTRLRELAKFLPEPAPALSAQYTQGLEAMAQHAGARLWSWQRNHPKVGSPSTVRNFGFGGIPVVMLILFAVQALRHCEDFMSTRSHYPSSAPQRGGEDGYRAVWEFEERYGGRYDLAPKPQRSFMDDVEEARQRQELEERLRPKMPTFTPSLPSNFPGKSSGNPTSPGNYVTPLPTPPPTPPPSPPADSSASDFEAWLERKRQERVGNQ